MGQELTARTKYRGLVKRRLVAVVAQGEVPPPGTPILRDGVEVGRMRSGLGSRGLALIRLDAMDDGLDGGGVRLTPRVSSWIHLPTAGGGEGVAQTASVTT